MVYSPAVSLDHQVQQQRIKNQAPHFTIHEETFCPVCKKRLGTRYVQGLYHDIAVVGYVRILYKTLFLSPATSAFARHPDGTIEHYFCAKEKLFHEQDNQKPVADTNPF